MPCENELKIVCRLGRYDQEFEDIITGKYGWQDIRQGYLTPSNRVRKSIYFDDRIEHVFTFKQRTENDRIIEIETHISEKDFNDLWEYTKERLIKRRSTVYLEKSIKWDIDFPRWKNGKRYFAIAEVEMPEDMNEPPSILEDIEQFVVSKVPRGDNRFSARKISNEKHAKALAKELKLL